jgi:hypothetical protein
VQAGDGGWEGPHHVIGHPLALEKLFNATDWRRDRFETVQRFVPFSRMPTTTLVVGALRAGTLFAGPFTIEVSDDHSDNWTRGVVTIQPSAHLWLDLPFPAAFAMVVNV